MDDTIGFAPILQISEICRLLLSYVSISYGGNGQLSSVVSRLQI